MAPTTDVDLLSPEAIADPYTPLARLRDEHAVVWMEAHDAWLVTRYDDVEAALVDLRLSSDRVGPVLERVREQGEESGRTEILELIKDWMVTTDPPAHTRLRKLAAGAFKNQRISTMADDVRAMVADVVAALREAMPVADDDEFAEESIRAALDLCSGCGVHAILAAGSRTSLKVKCPKIRVLVMVMLNITLDSPLWSRRRRPWCASLLLAG